MTAASTAGANTVCKFENKYQVTFQNPQGGLTPSLSLESVAKPKRINSIEVWDKAFRIFVGVFTQKYPLEAPHLMKYSEIIHDLAIRGQNWQLYDENFRFLRNLNVSSYSWVHVNWELWLRSQSYQGKHRPTHQPFMQNHSRSGPYLHKDLKIGRSSDIFAKSSLQPSSVPVYRRAWNLFNQFPSSVCQSVDFSLPVSPTILALFVAFLYDRQYAPPTVYTYVSALGYSHKLHGFPDPSKAFFIVQLLKGYGKVGLRLDSRLPLTLPILHRLIQAAAFVTNTLEQATLFQAMCSLAFSRRSNGFQRIVC